MIDAAMRPARRLAPIRVAAAALLVAGLCWAIVLANIVPALVAAGRYDVGLALSPRSALVTYLGGQAALARGDARASALAFQATLARAPLNQAALTQLALDTPARTASLLNLSAALGWRDMATQRVLTEAATGDPDLFALRFDAWARQTEDGPDAAAFLDERIVDPRIQAALTQRLLLRPGWRGFYLASLSRPDPALVAARGGLLRQLRAAGSPATRTDLIQYTARLRHFALEGAAHATWRDFAADPRRWSGALYDGRFHAVAEEGEGFPEQWTANGSADAYAAYDDSPAVQALHLHRAAPTAKPLLRQQAALTPGAYRARVTVAPPASTEAAGDGFVLGVACSDGRVLLRQAIGPKPGVVAMPFTVGAGCARQAVTLGVDPLLSAGSGDLWLTELRVEPTRR